MNGLLVLLLYAACLIMGFFGGIFGYFYADYRKRKEQEIENLKLKGQAEAEAIKMRAKALDNIQFYTYKITLPNGKVEKIIDSEALAIKFVE